MYLRQEVLEVCRELAPRETPDGWFGNDDVGPRKSPLTRVSSKGVRESAPQAVPFHCLTGHLLSDHDRAPEVWGRRVDEGQMLTVVAVSTPEILAEIRSPEPLWFGQHTAQYSTLLKTATSFNATRHQESKCGAGDREVRVH